MATVLMPALVSFSRKGERVTETSMPRHAAVGGLEVAGVMTKRAMLAMASEFGAVG